MKKFLVLTVVFAAIFLMVSCGGGDNGNDGGDSGVDTGDSGSEGGDTGTDTGDSGSEGSDTGADTGDSGSESGDTGDDTGDSGSEGGDSGADTGNEDDDTNSFECDMPGDYKCINGDSYVCQLLPTGDMIWGFNEECADGCDSETGACNAILRDCSESHLELCTDEETGLMWSKKSDYKNWTDANQYCEDLEELGFDDWRLPTIDELRTLILECEGTVTGGACQISEEADILSNESWTDDCYCEESSMGIYTKFGTDDWYDYLWSSSSVSDLSDSYWALDTSEGKITATQNEDSMTEARCVRLAE